MKRLFLLLTVLALAAAAATGCSSKKSSVAASQPSVQFSAGDSGAVLVQPSSAAPISPSSSASGDSSVPAATEESSALSEAVQQAALSYVGANAANGDTVTLLSVETMPDGISYCFVEVSAFGNTYELMVSADGALVFDSEDFNDVYGDDDEGDDDEDTDEDDIGGEDEDYDSDDVFDGYSGHGPDHAEP